MYTQWYLSVWFTCAEIVNTSVQLTNLNSSLGLLQSSTDRVQTNINSVKSRINQTLSSPNCNNCASHLLMLQTLTVDTTINVSARVCLHKMPLFFLCLFLNGWIGSSHSSVTKANKTRRSWTSLVIVIPLQTKKPWLWVLLSSFTNQEEPLTQTPFDAGWDGVAHDHCLNSWCVPHPSVSLLTALF